MNPLSPKARFLIWGIYGLISGIALIVVGFIWGATSGYMGLVAAIDVVAMKFVRMITSNSWTVPSDVAVVLVVAGALMLNGCTTVQSVATKTLDCAAPEIAKRTEFVIPQVIVALNDKDWSKATETLYGMAGDVVICAIQAIASEYAAHQLKPVEGIGGFKYSEQESARAVEWLKTHKT